MQDMPTPLTLTAEHVLRPDTKGELRLRMEGRILGDAPVEPELRRLAIERLELEPPPSSHRRRRR